MDESSLELIQTIQDTNRHVALVRMLIRVFAVELLKRGEVHDESKLSEEELSIFVKYSPKLKSTTYGSPEYKQFLAEMKPALDNHYAKNSHHPEHFENGIRGMTLVDLVEMLLDWWASTKRHADGDIMRSIDLNERRFNIPPELADILKNTIRTLETKV